MLVYKIAAALSDQGADLDAVEAMAGYVASRLGTLGVGLEHCHVSNLRNGIHVLIRYRSLAPRLAKRISPPTNSSW